MTRPPRSEAVRSPTYDTLFSSLARAITARGIELRLRQMDLERPAEFDGRTITINPAHDVESWAFYLAHSAGSIAAWLEDVAAVAAMFDELRAAKEQKDRDPGRLERAIAAFRAFETRASEYSVTLLHEAGHEWAVPAFSLFFRADLEAITQYHREGRAPVWDEHLARWRAEAADGRRQVELFRPRPLPDLRPVAIERQEVKQERRPSNRRTAV